MAGFRSKLGSSSLGRFKLGDVELTVTSFEETISNSHTSVPRIVEITALIDNLLTTATNVPSLINEQTVTIYDAETITNERTGAPTLLNDGYADLLRNTRTGTPTIIDIVETGNTDTLRNSHTATQTLVEIIDSTVDTLTATATNVPRISEIIDSTDDTLRTTATNVPSIVERFINNNLFPTGPGTGGEVALLKLAPTGVQVAVTLSAAVTAGAGVLQVSSVSGLPPGGGFVLLVDEEEIYVGGMAGTTLNNCRRAMGNTAAVAHPAGAIALWTDTYNMAIEVINDIQKDDDAPTALEPLFGLGTFDCFLVVLDCSQGYNEAGVRYATHVAACVGVFPDGTGYSDESLNKLDGSQPSSVYAINGLTDRCPVGLTIPARLAEDIVVGDQLVVRYKNIEDYILVLGPRSVVGQTWYGVIRVDDFNNDVTETDPNGNSIDGIVALTYPDSSALVAATMPASSRHFTRSSIGDPGILMSGLAVRNGNRRIPLWTSPNWHNFSYVYNGFGTDCNFIQCAARRKNVDLPSDSSLAGPNATWDDPTYFTSTAWHVVLTGYTADAVVIGPPTNGFPPPSTPPEVISIPSGGSTPGGGGGGGWTPPVDPDEGGSGGNIGGETPPVVATVSVDEILL